MKTSVQPPIAIHIPIRRHPALLCWMNCTRKASAQRMDYDGLLQNHSLSYNPTNQGSDKSHYSHSELTGKIIGCAMEVHRVLGNGFQEVIYQLALAIEITQKGLLFSREHERQIFYRGEDIGTRRVDFFVEGTVMVELKAIIALEDVHLAQPINYLEAYSLEVGLLINFGARSLQFKRVMKPRHKS